MSYNRRGYGMTTRYAVGDPFLGGVIKGVGKALGGVAKVAGGIIGGPVGGVLQGVGGIIAPTAQAAPPVLTSRPYGGSIGISTPVGFGGTLGINVGAQQYSGLPVSMAGGGMVPYAGAAAAPPQGYHLNKTGYFLKNGQYVPPRSRYVRNRRMNAANGRALRRSISRAKSFDNLVKRNRKNLRSLARI